MPPSPPWKPWKKYLPKWDFMYNPPPIPPLPPTAHTKSLSKSTSLPPRHSAPTNPEPPPT